jgi:para-aminobenzoate synthetase component 1
VIDPLAAYKKLNDFSPNPFSALYKLNDKWLLCASPERFFKKGRNKDIITADQGNLQANTRKYCK